MNKHPGDRFDCCIKKRKGLLLAGDAAGLGCSGFRRVVKQLVRPS